MFALSKNIYHKIKATNMKKFFTILQVSILLVGISSLMISCTKKTEVPETTPINQNNNYAFGMVLLLDKYGDVESNHSGIKVIMEGNGISRELVTSNNGRFEFKEIPAGEYTFTYIKDGVASGGQTAEISKYKSIPTIYLGPVAKHILVVDKVAIQNEDIQLYMTSFPAPASKEPVGYMIFASNSSDVSAGNAPFYKSRRSEFLDIQTVTVSELQKAGIDTNATIYLAIYPNTNSVSPAIVNGVISFPALNLSGKKVVSIKK
jgi:hypothetical protein